MPGTQFAFSPDGRLLAEHSAGEIVVWDMRTGLEVHRFGGQRGDVATLAFSANGRTLAVAFCDRAIELWDVATEMSKHSFDAHRGPVDCVAMSPDGATLATGSRADHSVVVWDLATRTPKRACADGAATVVSAAFSPDGATLAAGDRYPPPEIHAAHGYLLHSFYSQFSNRRGRSTAYPSRTARGSSSGSHENSVASSRPSYHS